MRAPSSSAARARWLDEVLDEEERVSITLPPPLTDNRVAEIEPMDFGDGAIGVYSSCRIALALRIQLGSDGLACTLPSRVHLSLSPLCVVLYSAAWITLLQVSDVGNSLGFTGRFLQLSLMAWLNLNVCSRRRLDTSSDLL
eukprot:scpid52853/ scgid28594/ 